MITCTVIDHDSIIDCLKQNGVGILPTDTVYGLVTLPGHKASAQRIFELKARPSNMNLQILVSSIQDIEDLGLNITHVAKQLLYSPWMPGAITLILGFDLKKSRPIRLQNREEVAIRIPNYPQLLQIIQKTGPILATSANHHGKPTPNNISDILNQLVGNPDVVVNGGIIETTPSTIINCNYYEGWKIEREGIISKKEVGLYLSS